MFRKKRTEFGTKASPFAAFSVAPPVKETIEEPPHDFDISFDSISSAGNITFTSLNKNQTPSENFPVEEESRTPAENTNTNNTIQVPTPVPISSNAIIETISNKYIESCSNKVEIVEGRSCFRKGRLPREPRRQVDFDGNLIANIANDENVRKFQGDTITVKNFEDKRVTLNTAKLHPDLLHNIINLQKYNNLLPLQEVCLGIMLDERRPNVLVKSPTGSGKTAAFGIPAVQIAKQNRNRAGPSVIIVCNTMNLAMQIHNHLMVFTGRVSPDAYPGIQPQVMDVQVFGMYKGGDDVIKLNDHNQPDIVVGTMGRLNASIESQKLNLANIRLFIADEGDKMMREEGFGRDIKNFLGKLPVPILERMQVATFSATFTYFENDEGEIDFEKDILKQLFRYKIPALINVDGVKGYITQRVIYIHHIIPKALRHDDLKVFENRAKYMQESIRNTYHCRKLGYLMALLNDDKNKYFNPNTERFEKTAVVFVERISTSNFLATYLISKGYKVAPLNSNYDLPAVKQILKSLVNGEIQAVISTNKLARGQDIPDLYHVIIYEMSNDFDDYKHRIGRTGRIGKGGISTAIVTDQDQKHFLSLFGFLHEHRQKIPMWLHDIWETFLSERNQLMGEDFNEQHQDNDRLI